MPVLQLVSVLGAGLILIAFFAIQRNWWTAHTPIYLWANLLGAILLAVVAAADRRIGFIVLEGTWAVVSLWGLVRLSRGVQSRSSSSRKAIPR